MGNMKAKILAHNLINDLENCMIDMAGGDEIVADEYWNDPGTLSDILGDRLFDRCDCLRTDDDKILCWEISDWILNLGHPALKTAIMNFKKRHGFI